MTTTADTLSRPVATLDRGGLVALLVGTGIIAWSGVLVRFADVGPLSSAAWRLLFALPVLVAWTRILDGRRRSADRAAGGDGTAARFPWAMALPIVFGGAAFAADVAVFHLSLGTTDIANASFIANIAPILVVIGGALFYREHPPMRIWFALALALFGSWMMAGLLAPSRLGHGDLLALGAALFYSSYILIMKRVRSRLDGPAATLWTAVISGLILLAMVAVSGEVFWPRSLQGWIVVALLGIGSHAAGQGLTSIGVGRVPVGIVAVVLLTWAPMSAFLAWAVLGEGLSPLQVAGAAIILSALVIARPK